MDMLTGGYLKVISNIKNGYILIEYVCTNFNHKQGTRDILNKKSFCEDQMTGVVAISVHV